MEIKPHATRFLFIDKGDPSVGISGQSVLVEYQGGFYTNHAQREFIEAVKDGLSNVMDVDQVIHEHEHTCRHCKEKFLHLDDWCEDICSKKECHQAEADAETAYWNEQETRMIERDDLLHMGSGAFGTFDFDKDYWRERNARTLSRINGAGVRC